VQVRDKRGLEIQVGDTLVAGCGQGAIDFIEVEEITQQQVRCSGIPSAPAVVVGRNLDGDRINIFDPYNYVSVCACYRDARSS